MLGLPAEIRSGYTSNTSKRPNLCAVTLFTLVVGIPACCAIHVHFQGPGHRLACLSTAGCPPGNPPSPVCRSIQSSPQRRQDLHHRGPGRCEDGLHWPPEAGVRPPCWHRIRSTTGHSFRPHDSLWMAGTLSRLPLGAVVSAGRGGVDTAGLAL